RRTQTPFASSPRGAEARDGHWVEPSLVAEVSFAQWTEDRVLRQAVFHGLREDKLATDVKTERIAATPGRSNSPTDVGGVRITHHDRVLFTAEAVPQAATCA